MKLIEKQLDNHTIKNNDYDTKSKRIGGTEMKVEIRLNELENDWWFELGVCFQKTEFHPTTRYVFTIGIMFFNIYIRF